MEPERSLPYTQETAAGPYPETHESIPQPHTVLLQRAFSYYPLLYAYVFQVTLSLQVSD